MKRFPPELQVKIDALPFPRLKPEDVALRVAKVDFLRVRDNVLVCDVELDNGYSERGESPVFDVRNYKQDIGEEISHRRAMDKIWGALSILMYEERFQAAKKLEFEHETRNWRESVVDLMKRMQLRSDLTSRHALAVKLGYTFKHDEPSGSEDMNLFLLEILRTIYALQKGEE